MRLLEVDDACGSVGDLPLENSTLANQNSLVKWSGGNWDEEELIQRKADHRDFEAA